MDDFILLKRRINMEEIDTSDYKLDKHGRKIKAHRLVFNKGEDDGKKGVSEQMKKSFDQFMQEHTPDLTEEQLNELVAELQEVLGKSDPAGKWISDFVHSDNPKFAGKSKEKRKQMALAAYYAKQRNEEAEIEESNNTQKKFTVVHYSPKTDRNVTKKIKANSESEVWDRLKAKGINPVSVKEDHVAEGYGVGWMLRADPKLGAKVKAKTDAAKLRQKYMGKTSDEIEKMRKEKAKQTNEALRLSPEAGKKLSAAVASAAKGGKVHFQSTSVGKDGKKTTEHGYTDSEGNRVVTKVVKEEEHMDEALKGNQHKIDKNKNGKIDAHDFKLLRKEDRVEEMNKPNKEVPTKETTPPADKAKKMWAIKPPARTEKPKLDVLKKEEIEQIDELSVDTLERYKRKAGEQMKQNTDATATHDRVAKPGKEKVVAKRIAGRSLATHKQVQQMYKQMNKEESSIEEAQSHQAKTTMKHIDNPTAGEKKAAKDIKPGIAGFRDRIAMLKSAEARGALKKEEAEQIDELSVGTLSDYQKAASKSVAYGGVDYKKDPNKFMKRLKGYMTAHDKINKKLAIKEPNLKKEEVEQMDEMWPGTAEYKKKFPDTERTTGRGERHDIEKTSTGVKATRRYSTDDTTEKPANAPKRGRGRPKKDKFAEAVDFLMSVNEDQFEELIAEGFDAFFEAYERAVTK
jgi:hypothetical protein